MLIFDARHELLGQTNAEAVRARRQQLGDCSIALGFASPPKLEQLTSRNLGLDTRSLAVQPRAKLLQTDISITVATEHIPNILIHDVQTHFSTGIIQS
ncbi:hypothetical protein WL99_09280 [Burkholderia cepacia]|uniref:hypothetical protein n=1 Tax=Burkholderia cepacia TaxID=292 RepID=UPI000755B891|nr:hypothetical protein [Burkholderia cepacia]KWH33102.1 hypothetical protein WL99_09280 [Burkholderia cepacia]MDN7899303.1 hypothetical protein [Burkholderia cepacia]